MEYNVLNTGELVLSSEPHYLSESRNRQNTRVVLVPLPYQAPEPFRQLPFQSIPKASYNSQEISYPSIHIPFRNPQGIRHPTFQVQSLQGYPETSFQSQPDRQIQVPSHQDLKTSQSSRTRSQSFPNMTEQSMMEDFLSINSSGDDKLAGQDIGSLENTFDIDMATPLLDDIINNFTSTLPETSSDAVCTSCGHRSLRSSIEELSISQKKLGEKVDKITKALSLFAGDVISDIEENKQWRISVEEKLDRLLTGHNGDGESDY